MKPTKESVSIVIKDKSGKFLVVKRADDPDDELAGVWGFPAVTLKGDENHRAGCERIGYQKLGVKIRIGQKIDDSTHEKKNYILHLTDHEATITEGVPLVPQTDTGVRQYTESRFTNDPTILFEAARKGSQCTQIFLESIGSNWTINS